MDAARPWSRSPTSPRARLDGVRDARRSIPVINATGVHHPHQPRAGAVAVGGRSSRRRHRTSGRSCSSSTGTTGRRGARARIAEDHLVALTGAEDALVTNNNAAAACARGRAGRTRRESSSRAASWSRSAAASGSPRSSGGPGARLIEVGTTNRTRTADFEGPLAEGRARAVLRVHPSNFAMSGFTEAPDPPPRSRSSRTATARSSSTTSGPARCSTPRPSASPTSRCRTSGSPPAPTS